MLQVDDYVQLDQIGQYEFGFALIKGEKNPYINVFVANHETFTVRTLDTASTLEEAFSVVTDCIQSGFDIEGLKFGAIPGYSILSPEEIPSAR